MDRQKKQLCAALRRGLENRKFDVPAGGSELMAAFLALSRARSMGSNGPNPISWEAIAAWVQLMRVPLAPRHVEIIMALDDVWLKHAYGRSTPPGVKTLPPTSDQPLTAALLDAVMG